MIYFAEVNEQNGKVVGGGSVIGIEQLADMVPHDGCKFVVLPGKADVRKMVYNFDTNTFEGDGAQ